MRKLFLFLVIISLAVAASWVANNAGVFQLNWLGYHIEGSVAFMLACFLAAACLIWLVLHWINSLLHLPGELQKERGRLMNEKGLSHITQAMIASSENKVDEAKKHLNKARDYLPESPLPRLLQLQLAGRSKDTNLAHRQFVQLQHYDETKPLALRGLAEQARLQGNMDEALAHTEALLEQAPNEASSQKLAIDIFSYHRRWQEAMTIVKKAYAQRHLSADEYKRAKATIAMQQATIMQGERNRQGAVDMLKNAFSTDPSLQPAAIEYATLLKQLGKTSQAAKTLKQAWKYAPHPKIAASYIELYADEESDKQAKKMQDLAKQNSDAIESHILQAEAAMILEKWDVAKNHIKIGLSKQTTVSLCRLMARLSKRGYSDEEEERRWLEKAVTATPDAHWTCINCGIHPKEWRAHCKNCHDFATIYWRPERALVG